MNIRTMTYDDYDEVYSLWLNTPGMGINTYDDSREGICRYLARNPETCFVAEKDGKIIGVILSGHDGRRGFIHHTAVDGRAQRLGLGSALVDTALSALGREGIKKVALVCYRENDRGNAFWEKQGFTVREDLFYRNKEMVELVYVNTGDVSV